MISTSDALTCYHLQQRSASDRHQDAAQLIKKLPLAGAVEKTQQFLDVVSLKNQVEYGFQLTSEKQALQLAKQTERFYTWAKDNLPKPAG